MTDQHTSEPAHEEHDQPRIILTFRGPGMADFAIAASPNIEPAQVYAAAFVIDAWAREIRAGVELERARQMAAQAPTILVPNRQQRRHPTDA